MIKIGICDDRDDQRQDIKFMLETFLKEKDFCYEIDTFCDGFSLIDEFEKGKIFDLLLLDICMPGLLGTEIAKSIRMRKDKTEIVFITSSDEFAVDAFALKATHYLIKPVTQKDFNEGLERAFNNILSNKSQILIIKIKNGIREISTDEIFYIESNSHTQTIYLENESVETRENISELLEKLLSLCGNQFGTPCKGFIVNFGKVKILQKNELILTNYKKVPISTRSFIKVKEQYFNFIF